VTTTTTFHQNTIKGPIAAVVSEACRDSLVIRLFFLQQAIELGSTTLLVDEDTCATNFMICDEKMMQLVANDKEPITPFVHFVRSLHRERQKPLSWSLEDRGIIFMWLTRFCSWIAIVVRMLRSVRKLLVDEDTCATNFMIRDAKMMQLCALEQQ
jgi:hypothetical protein